MPALCRDCLAWTEADPGPRCPSCRGRRLLSHPELGTLSIAHLDCDAFYASVEKREDPSLADKPLIVGGGRRGVVTTCCYIARIHGVRSAMPMFKALKLCPDAVVLKPRMDLYVAVSRAIRAELDRLTPLVEPLSLDEAFLDLSGTERLLGAPPALSLARLAAAIHDAVGVTVSIGLSHNKYLAKLASDLDKPRGFAVIGRAETKRFLAPRPVRSIWGVGGRFAARLEGDGFHTNGDLSAAGEERLRALYGSAGARLARLSRGEDDRSVDPDGAVKSISAETTFDTDTAEREVLEGHLWRLAVRASDRAKAKGIAGASVALKLKTASFRTITRQTRLSDPTSSAEILYRAGERLLDKVIFEGPFRLIGIGFSALSDDEQGQAGLLADERAAFVAAEKATDRIRARYGKDAIIRGRALR
ncbi:MAG: DNA polymerase IV [Pseudomonadota bacterium]